ncbi:hypothetical protein sscle_07g061980 [Sclerotinia sclerotiorum 1980 UF-70]|uniref:Uncharacterized protein n=1 Tax=Sclerotinia sclerotiorum (strain ATCC 18683 / 1980 / Ss-1) TaxID=665079 RepID=A0A1D9Q912_SCLS1|nr:hypothetical protein sscle_07g061980 [Sclerotinia sclerotiorum 1980 UF-70]
MRLLKCDNAGGYRLTKALLDNNIPPYAILSHTGNGKAKTGYKKLQFCGNRLPVTTSTTPGWILNNHKAYGKDVFGPADGLQEDGRSKNSWLQYQSSSFHGIVAENRTSTREEDAAYSLLGIFGVSISVIYGEGRDNTFRRLNSVIDSNRDYLPSPDKRCLIDLFITDTRKDKQRTEELKR